jgi:redox-sensitive bicupin YhaK (pirin superfamily)
MEAPRRGDGQDFDWSRPYRMYHGDKIPGFPQHPHRGFETLTAVLAGNCDHTDSLGNSGRFSSDDLQWMTAGKGVVHSENFPLVHQDKPNTLRLFQIWLNLPARSKMVAPSYKMLWAEQLVKVPGTGGAVARVFAGALGSLGKAQAGPSASWGVVEENDVGVFHLTLPAGGSSFTFPPANYGAAIARSLYIVDGQNVSLDGRVVPGKAAVELNAEYALEVTNTHATAEAEVLVLQGRPIGEPVAQHGPFVMNTRKEIEAAFSDYQRTQFGGWPWPEDAVAFPRDAGRFSSMKMDGKTETERPGQAPTS